MIDIIPHVAELLAPTGAQIELSYQNTTVTFPLIVLSVPSYVPTVCGKTEVWTRLSVQVDVYTQDKRSSQILADRIDDILLENGYRLTNAFPLTEDGLERLVMTFTCFLDSNNTIITT